MAKEHYRLGVEFTLLRLNKQLVLEQTLEDLPNVLGVHLERVLLYT